MNKQEVISKLKDYIEVLEDDNVRLDSVTLRSIPDYTEVKAGDELLDFAKSGENFDIDFDVTYINRVDV